MTADAILTECARRGIHLRAEGDRIKYRPRDVVDGDAELLAAMRRHKPALLAELRRDAAVADAWERLRIAFERAGRPDGWLTPDVRMAEHVVSELWLSARGSTVGAATDDHRFHAELRRWERIATGAIAEAAERGQP